MDVRYDSDALAGCIADLAHTLGVDVARINRLTIRPADGHIAAEVWTGEDERDPLTGSTRPGFALRGWTFPLNQLGTEN